MKHFGIHEWVDFGRGLTPVGDIARMGEHLASGCKECKSVVDFCGKLAVVCRSMANVEVPASAVRLAYSVFPAQAVPTRKRTLRIPIELIFDSFMVPSVAGVRSGWQVGWQALYQAGDCSLDLRVEPELNTSRAALMGQISNYATPDSEMPDLPVILKAGKLVIAETRSNRFGEFQLEYEQQNRLQLHIFLEGGGRCIQVPLKRLVAEKPSIADRL